MQRLVSSLVIAGALALAVVLLATGCENILGSGNGDRVVRTEIDATITWEDAQEPEDEPDALEGTVTVAGEDYDLETMFVSVGPVADKIDSLRGIDDPTPEEIKEAEDAVAGLDRAETATFRLFFLIGETMEFIGLIEEHGEELILEQLEALGVVIKVETENDDPSEIAITFDGYPNVDALNGEEGIEKFYELVLGTGGTADGNLTIEATVNDDFVMTIKGELTFREEA